MVSVYDCFLFTWLLTRLSVSEDLRNQLAEVRCGVRAWTITNKHFRLILPPRLKDIQPLQQSLRAITSVDDFRDLFRTLHSRRINIKAGDWTPFCSIANMYITAFLIDVPTSELNTMFQFIGQSFITLTTRRKIEWTLSSVTMGNRLSVLLPHLPFLEVLLLNIEEEENDDDTLSVYDNPSFNDGSLNHEDLPSESDTDDDDDANPQYLSGYPQRVTAECHTASSYVAPDGTWRFVEVSPRCNEPYLQLTHITSNCIPRPQNVTSPPLMLSLPNPQPFVSCRSKPRTCICLVWVR